MSDLMEKVYQAFDPGPLGGDADLDKLYVDLDDVRGRADVVNRLANKIRLSDTPTCQVLAGHKGSGKSTELRRLQRQLETATKRYFVVFCDSDEDIDRNDVDFLEVLIAIMRQTSIHLREEAGIKLKPGYFRDRWERIWNLLGSKVELDSVELEAGFATISTTVKASPDARLRLRELIENDTGNWLHAANDLIGDAVLKLKKKGYHGLVVLVDDLDKIVLRPHHKAGCSTGEYLFVHREAQLSAFGCHTVYTMPLALAYSPLEATIAGLYGGQVPIVPMVKINEPPPKGGDCVAGLEKCREIVRRRLESAGTNVGDVFDSAETLDMLIRFTGGQPTELMYFAREALITSFPITAEAVGRPVRERRKAYARQLRAEHWPIINEVRKSGRFTRTEQTDEAIRDLLDSRAVLQYANDGEWYAVNPVIESEPSSPT
ncbi:MAG TPA: ATP-binding protein [Phycisphaerae bacterium]|nr:ATP-binding protein [Phycisphaerae bacterium]